MSDRQEKDEEKFLSRWSRRKIAARGGAGEPDGEPDGEQKSASLPLASPPAVPHSGAGESSAQSSPGAPLPPVEELRGVESEYRDFLRPEVDEALRRSALKNLFQDPHFNIMDGLDTYIDDYTKADPIPEAMLRGLNQAQGLLFEREDEQRAGEKQPAAVDAADRPPPVTEVVTEPVTEAVTEEVTKLSSPEAKEDGNHSQSGPDTSSATT